MNIFGSGQHSKSSITFGRQLEKLCVEGFVLIETLHAPHLVLPRHDHECANINLNLKGSFREIIGSNPEDSAPSSLLFKPEGEHHANQYGSLGAHGLVIEVLPQKMESIRKFSKLFDAPLHIRGGALFPIALKIYREFRSVSGIASELMIEGLILEMLASAARQIVKTPSSITPPGWLRRVRDFIHENFAEQMSLSKAAAAAGVNPTYLAQAFRKYYGCSIGDYVKRRQIEYAVRQLTDTQSSLSEIAASAGFYDQSHFTRAFKLQTKMTPAEFRAAVQKSKDNTKTCQFYNTI